MKIKIVISDLRINRQIPENTVMVFTVQEFVEYIRQFGSVIVCELIDADVDADVEVIISDYIDF